MPDLSVVVACYNEEGHLEASVREIQRTLESTRYTYEIIFVDDQSRDATLDIITRLVKADPAKRRGLFNQVNMGRGGTVTRGMREAKGQWVGFLDIDLEVGAHYVPYCLQALADGADVVTAWRIYKIEFGSLFRFILSKGYSRLARAMLGHAFHDTETGFKFFRRQAILPVLDETESNGWFWDTEIMARCALHGLRVVEKPCLFLRRKDKKSTVHVLRDTLGYFKALLSFRIRLRRRIRPATQ